MPRQWRLDLRRLQLAEFRSSHAEIGLPVLQPAGLHELVEGKVDLLIARGLGIIPAIAATGSVRDPVRVIGWLRLKDQQIVPKSSASAKAQRNLSPSCPRDFDV
jgi:hypothetical protein